MYTKIVFHYDNVEWLIRIISLILAVTINIYKKIFKFRFLNQNLYVSTLLKNKFFKILSECTLT